MPKLPPPTRIYLQAEDYVEDDPDWDDAFWCKARIYDGDIAYVREDLVALLWGGPKSMAEFSEEISQQRAQRQAQGTVGHGK